jgi:hypothetical protein
MTSPVGREILAEVLDAAAAVLRRNRTGEEIMGAVSAAAERTGNAASTAMEVGSEVAAGAADAGQQIAAAAVDMAETAAGALATMATEAVLGMLPEGSDSDRKRRGGSGGTSS